MNVSIQLLRKEATVPAFGSDGAAGADLYAAMSEAVTLAPGETALIPTGIAMAIPAGFVGLIFARSGLAVKRGLAPANKVGVIDSDYRGEILVALHNHAACAQRIEPGERIAQIAIMPVERPAFQVTDALDETKRGVGGFGSTGTK